MSAIRQDVLWRSSEFRKSSAEANAFTRKPIELIRSRVVARTVSSSSTIEIKGFGMLAPALSPKLAPDNLPIPLCVGGFNTEKRTGESLGRGTALARRA